MYAVLAQTVSESLWYLETMDVAANGRCTNCGELVEGADACPSCGTPLQDIARRPRFTFALLIILLILGFSATGFMVRGFEARRDQLARRWFGRGNIDLQTGAALKAVNEFQTALAYSPNNSDYRLKLAVALMGAGQWEEARAHLISLWEERPGDGEINLLLARVFAERNLFANAVRYYQGAIYGVWNTDPVGNRRMARFELVDFLLSKGRTQAAQSELIALAAEPPASPQEQLKLANLMMQADEPQRALDMYLQLRHKLHTGEADLGAAQASYAVARYLSAYEYAKDALRADPKSNIAQDLFQRSEALVKADPRTPGISGNDRLSRTYSAYLSASDRLLTCMNLKPDDLGLQQLQQYQKDNFSKLRPKLLREPDLRDDVLRWAFDVEATSAKSCGTPSGYDALLLQLAQAQERYR